MKKCKVKKEYQWVYRVKLTHYELRVLINVLNNERLRMKERGESTTEIRNGLLKLLDLLESF